MDHKEDVHVDTVFELGVASVETKGQAFGIPEDQGRVLTGIPDE